MCRWIQGPSGSSSCESTPEHHTDSDRSKWRFTSLPDFYNILRAVSVLALTLLVLDYVLVAPNVLGAFFACVPSFFSASPRLAGLCCPVAAPAQTTHDPPAAKPTHRRSPP